MSQPNPTSSNNRENRQAERVSTDRPVQLTHDSQKHQAKMINLSITGLGILSNFKLDDSQNIQIDFELPFYDDYTSVKLQGTVIHCTPVRGQYLLGVALNNLNKHQTLVMENFIKFKTQPKQ